MAQAFQFSSPNNYSDWANYAGFDRVTGEQKDYVPNAIAPTSVSEFMDQAVSPFKEKINQVSGIASNLGQGNIMGAYNAYKAKPLPMVNPLTATTAPPTDGFAYHVNDLDY